MPKTKDQPETKKKAEKYPILQLTVINAYRKSFSTGSTGFFGLAQDPNTGKKYQITGAVEIGSKPN
ncbi:MAG: hypothetical protein WC359_12910 [Dehalococcoidia bacterium]|jgi:hypothetical protein